MKPLHYGIVIAAALLATAASSRGGASQLHPAHISNLSSRATDGAYRDGLFIGHLDRTRGARHHLASGRWNNSVDRQSFVAGYERGYSAETAQ